MHTKGSSAFPVAPLNSSFDPRGAMAVGIRGRGDDHVMTDFRVCVHVVNLFQFPLISWLASVPLAFFCSPLLHLLPPTYPSLLPLQQPTFPKIYLTHNTP